MNKRRTQSITYGALMASLLGVLLFINYRLGNILDLYLFWIIPLPVIVYCVMFGTRQTLTMAAAMILVSVIIAQPVTVFYVVGSVVAGIIYGHGVIRGRSAPALILSVFAVSFIMVVLSTFVMASFFGYNLNEEIVFMRDFITSYMNNMGLGQAMPEYMTGTRFILTIIIISSILSSLLEGVLVHLLAYIVLRKLRLPLPPMKKFGNLYAPVYLKVLVFSVFFAYFLSAVTQVTKYNEALMALTIVAMMICVFFGYLFLIVLVNRLVPNPRYRAIVVMLAAVLTFPTILSIIGLIDMFTNMRKRMLKEMSTDGKTE